MDILIFRILPIIAILLSCIKVYFSIVSIEFHKNASIIEASDILLAIITTLLSAVVMVAF